MRMILRVFTNTLTRHRPAVSQWRHRGGARLCMLQICLRLSGNQNHARENDEPDQDKRFRQLPKGMSGQQWENIPWNFLQYFPLFTI